MSDKHIPGAKAAIGTPHLVDSLALLAHADTEYLNFTSHTGPGGEPPKIALEGLNRCSICNCFVSKIQWHMHQTYHSDEANYHYTMTVRHKALEASVVAMAEKFTELFKISGLSMADLVGHEEPS